MNQASFVVQSPKNPAISIAVTPGHFATSSSHISHYLDMNAIKTNAAIAREVARELAAVYLSSDLVDTIICLENTEIVGAYLAQELFQEGTLVMNSCREIHVITPMNNVNGQLVFQQSEIRHVRGKHVILLMASVSSGKTVSRALECLHYYGGVLVGISALFSAIPAAYGQDIHAVFTDADIPGYHFATPGDCDLCREKRKLDAIVNYGGYTEL